jgi:hypothetical protein
MTGITPTRRRKLDLSDAERLARSERARALHERGVFGGADIGAKGGQATAAKVWEETPPEADAFDQMSHETLADNFVALLGDFRGSYVSTMLAVDPSEDAETFRELLGNERAERGEDQRRGSHLSWTRAIDGTLQPA